uniref:SpaA isopeptide-forming pilin-related protein n=1 Tax=Ruminococcus bromii TaxID=40518 RepID=UPI003FEEDE06
MKLIKKILSVFLCLTVIIGSLSVGSFSVSAASVKGNRGADGKGFIYKKTAEYTYTDANGKKHSQHYEGWENFKVHFFAPSGKTLNFSDYTQRAYCIEPDKASELTGSATVKSTSQSAAWKQLTTAQQNAVNLILAWGFGGFEAAKKEKVHYYYATQLLIFEIVAGKRNASTFDAVSGKPLLTPANTMTATSSAETTVANVTTAYDNMVSWCKRSVRNPSYTASSLSSAKSYQMSYNQSNGQYSITLTDKNGTASVTKASDVIVSNSNVKVSVSGKKITFTCSKNLGTTVNVTMKNSFLKEHGIKSKNSLYLITSNDYASYQTFAQGSNYTVKDGYVKLTFPDVVKLQLHKSSSNKELTAGNGCYSLSGAEYGIYTDKACTQKIGSITTNASGYGSYSKYVDASASYYAKETKAPKGYELDETVYTFVNSGKKAADGTKIYSFSCTDDPVNDPVGIILQKKNAVTGETTSQGLGGAVFSIEYYAQEIDKDYDVKANETAPALDSKNLKRTWYIQTDEDGYCDLNKKYLASEYSSDDFYYTSAENPVPAIPIGTVVIREVKAPEGYSLSDVVFYRHISEEIAEIAKDTNTPINVPINEMPAKAYVGINKLNQSGIGVANAVYGLYSDSACASLYDKLTTNADGKGTFAKSVDVGKTYYIKEITAPTGYELDETVYPVIATVDNATVDTAVIQTIYEDAIKADLKIKKSSTDGIVSNLWFAISDNLGNEYNAVSTDKNGEATVKGLRVYDDKGNKITYTVKELGFKTTLGAHSYGGYTWTIKKENAISYKGSYYEGVSNAVFSNCENAYSRYYYGKSSEAKSNANGKSFTLDESKTVTFNFQNTVSETDLTVKKTSYNGKVSGVWFEVQDENGKYYGSIVTDSSGTANYYNRYGYKLKSCLTVPNSAICIPIKYKVVEKGFLGGSSYYFPDNYLEKAESEFKTANKYGTTSTLNYFVYNAPATGRININKTSEDGVIEGLSFKLESFDDEREFGDDLIPTPMAYDAAGNEITSIVLTTDKNGKASTDNEQFYDVNGNTIDGILPYVFNQNGFQITYRLTEIGIKQSDGTYKFPSRYELKDAVEFTIYDTDENNYTYDCVNTVKTGSLQVQKTSEDDVVDGLYFEISCAETGFNEKVNTDLEGLSPEISDLPIYNSNDELLKYKVTELGELNEDGTYSLPYKYNKPKSVTVTLNSDTVVFANIKNTLKTGSVKLTKTDGTKALTGSCWQLYKSDDTPVRCIQNGTGSYMYLSESESATDCMATNGTLLIRKLPVGDYYFVESVTPSGYMPYGKKVEFTISADNENTLNMSLTVADNKSVLSQTGGGGIAPFYFVAVALGAMAIIFIYDYRKHGSKKYKKSRKDNQK